jgi:hypothetical protein
MARNSLLKYHCKTKWVVENVNPYYDMFIPGQLIQRHVFWANFYIDQNRLSLKILEQSRFLNTENTRF